MGKTIILIHGRSYKPKESDWKKWWKDALSFGIQRDFPSKLQKFNQTRLTFVYYGDISNAFLSKEKKEPVPNDFADRKQTLASLKVHGKKDFTRSKYRALPGYNPFKEALADTFAPILSGVRVAKHLIPFVAPDMAHYWNEETTYGTEVRARMINPLKNAMDRNDKIMVISHSLGTMISYDTFWKFCRYGEYRPKYNKKKIDLWLTLGSPLADETVKRTLKGASLDSCRKYPDNISRWINVSAEDDYISHDQRLKNDYKKMAKCSKMKSIEDRKIYNLAIRNGSSNPHSSVGYLIHPTISEIVANWL